MVMSKRLSKKAKQDREQAIAEFKATLKRMPEHMRKSYARGWIQADKVLRRK